MKQAVILHTIEDVKHCLKHGLHKDAKLFSANVNVVYYLRYQCGLECEDLCSALSTNEILSIQENTRCFSQLLLAELDQRVSPDINKQLGLEIHFFEAVYSFLGSKQLSLYAMLVHSFLLILEKYSLDTIWIYEGLVGPLQRNIYSFLTKGFPLVSFHVVYYQNRGVAGTRLEGIRIPEILEVLPKFDSQKFKDKTTIRRSSQRKNILLIEPFEQCQLLLQTPGEFSVYSFNPSKSYDDNIYDYIIDPNNLPLETTIETICNAQGDMKKMLSLYYEDISNDFCKNIIRYLSTVHLFCNLHKEVPIHDLFWGNSPLAGVAALLVAVFLNNKFTRVVGVQSRGTYFLGKAINSYAPDLLVKRCHFFLTQGATEWDMNFLYPAISNKVTIVSPSQEGELASQEAKRILERKAIDVAVYLQLSLPFLQTGSCVSNLVNDQYILLDFLNRYKNKEIHILITANSSSEYYALLSVLNVMKNITLMEISSLNDYLTNYNPELIIIDALMPELECILNEEIRIVLMENKIYPFSNDVLNRLKSCTYYAEYTEKAIDFIKDFFLNNLPIKRNYDYKQKYLNSTGMNKIFIEHVNT